MSGKNKGGGGGGNAPKTGMNYGASYECPLPKNPSLGDYAKKIFVEGLGLMGGIAIAVLADRGLSSLTGGRKASAKPAKKAKVVMKKFDVPTIDKLPGKITEDQMKNWVRNSIEQLEADGEDVTFATVWNQFGSKTEIPELMGWKKLPQIIREAIED